ncbi:SDR family oxidoreductase, partial [Myxococcota bacterium]|nr:SDR family oxidoreductase [Myxococcota bacterium]
GHVWHLAAIYDLSVPQAVAYRVNVQGTRNVLRFCEGLPQLQRLNYISTCYVAGDRTGHIFEDELDRGQGFKNHYESTKFWAELAVQEYFSSLPITIFRPAIVVGDSKTGETAKGDGPYNALHLLKQLPGWLPVPTPGSAAAPVNLVPVDFLVEAMAQISAQEKSVGKVFHLADPSPISARDVLALTSQCMNKGPVLGKLPLRLVEWLVRYESVVSLSGIGSDSLAYYNHEARFDVSNTAAALGDSLHCPRIDDYWQVAVDYAQRHPEIFAGHLPGHTKPAAFAN